MFLKFKNKWIFEFFWVLLVFVDEWGYINGDGLNFIDVGFKLFLNVYVFI